MKKAATAAERRHMDRVAQLGCIMRHISQEAVCSGEICLHHSRTRPDGQNYGMSQRASNYEVIPLCGYHHQTGPIEECLHAGPRAWEHRWNTTELQLLEMVSVLLVGR